MAFESLLPRFRRPGTLDPRYAQKFGDTYEPIQRRDLRELLNGPAADPNDELPPPRVPGGPSIPQPPLPSPPPIAPPPSVGPTGPTGRPSIFQRMVPGGMGRPGFDPMTLALFLAPIAELLKHGAGGNLYSAALQGMQQRTDADERRAERERILQERADERAERQEDRKLTREERAARAKEREAEAERDAARRRDDLVEAYTKNPALRDYIRSRPEAQGIDFDGLDRRLSEPQPDRPLTPSEKLARERFEYDKTNAPSGQESPKDRMNRIRVSIKEVAEAGDNSQAARKRIYQLAKEIGVDPAIYLSRLEQRSRERGQKSANVQARTNRTNRPPAARGGSRRPGGPLSPFYTNP